VKIVDQDYERPQLGVRTGEPAQEGKKLPLLRVRIHLRRRALRIGDAEELEDHRENFEEALIKKQNSPSDPSPRFLVGVHLGDAEIAAEELEDREVRYDFSVRGAVPFVDEDVPRPAALDELITETALADSRICDDADDLAVALKSTLERVFE